MNANLVAVNDYGVLPIPLDVVKSFLRVTSSDDDALITLFLNSAINYAENKLGVVVGKRDYKLSFYGENSDISLPKPYITQVTSVKVAGREAEFDLFHNYLRVKKENNGKLVEIQFTCENMHFGEALSIAILRHVFFLYENRSVTHFDRKEIESIYLPLINNNYNI